jgi:predicted ATP-grasp superfamily ATP-dependent carboligase
LELPLLIAGWSTRAAAHSARRAAVPVAAIDAFCDADLAPAVDSCRRASDVRGLVAAAEAMPPGEWMYVGGLENHPQVVAAMSRRHRLLGTGGVALRRLRDPGEFGRVVRQAGLRLPETLPAGERPDAASTHRWVIKRRRSAGGVGVSPWTGTGGVPRGAYLQQLVDGEVCGATYVAAAGRSRLLGVCRQFCVAGRDDRPFIYGGSIGPMEIEASFASRLSRLGDAITAEFEIVGLFGVDFVLAPDGAAWPLEVNPRYTASVEILERATGAALLATHLAACRGGVLPADAALPTTVRHGKRIVYHDGEVDQLVSAECSARWLEQAGTGVAPPIADIPVAGTRLRGGDPIATVFAEAASDAEVARRLIAAERRLLDDLRSGS